MTEIATSKGEIKIGGMTLTVYHTESGKRIIPKSEFERFMKALGANELEADAVRELSQYLREIEE